MKIGYLLSPGTMIAGLANGIRQQAVVWKNELELRGHEVTFLDASGIYDWSSFSLVHVFQGGDWLRNVMPSLRKKVSKIIFSPIIDSNQHPALYNLSTHLEIPLLRMRTENVITCQAAQLVDSVFVRSQHEWNLIERGLRIAEEKIKLVKIGFKIREIEKNIATAERLPVCLHLSLFTERRKNVSRLIEACGGSKLELWIAGKAGDEKEFKRLQGLAKDKPVRFLGFQSEAELSTLMSQVRVFALPTLCEGVGLAALEAAAAGCEIVITKNGGPPDYFGKLATYVDPQSTDSITEGLKKAFAVSYQPELQKEILANYSPEASVDALERDYLEIIS